MVFQHITGHILSSKGKLTQTRNATNYLLLDTKDKLARKVHLSFKPVYLPCRLNIHFNMVVVVVLFACNLPFLTKSICKVY